MYVELEKEVMNKRQPFIRQRPNDSVVYSQEQPFSDNGQEEYNPVRGFS